MKGSERHVASLQKETDILSYSHNRNLTIYSHESAILPIIKHPVTYPYLPTSTASTGVIYRETFQGKTFIPELPVSGKRKSSKIRDIEITYGRPLEHILYVGYVFGRKSSYDLAKQLGITSGYTGRKLRELGIIRTKSEGLRVSWEEKKAEITKKTQSPQAQANRSNALKENWKTAERREAASAAAKRRRERKFAEKLGEDWLSQLTYLVEHKPLETVARQLQVAPVTIKAALGSAEIDRQFSPKKPGAKIDVGNAQTVNRAITNGSFFRLSPQEQQLLWDRFQEKLTIGEVAQRRQRLRQSVSKSIARALKKLP